eukprot:TRINITY_DN9436_c0_g1_i1.p1 TRINITY_DN9436_c0_g1~~TRINITY_DN9436_c0_g1_i1.p1  ORF type:complete len:108 (-),score=0.55 TRINITY_DN9436_c0_g1_i1:58-381(-)
MSYGQSAYVKPLHPIHRVSSAPLLAKSTIGQHSKQSVNTTFTPRWRTNSMNSSSLFRDTICRDVFLLATQIVGISILTTPFLIARLGVLCGSILFVIYACFTIFHYA